MRQLLLAALLAAPALAAATEVVPVPVSPAPNAQEARDEATRLALRLGYSDDATLEPDAAKVAEIQSALAAVRALEPRLNAYNLRFMGPPDDRLLIGYEDAKLAPLTAAYQAASPLANGARGTSALNWPELDAAAASMRANFELKDAFGTVYLTMRFGRPVDLQKASRRVSRVPGVSYAQADQLIGGPGLPIFVDADPAGGWRVTATRGWGDCMAGCINREYWYFTVRAGLAAAAGHYARVYDPKTNSYRETGVRLGQP